METQEPSEESAVIVSASVWSLSVMYREREREMFGVQGKVVKEWRWLCAKVAAEHELVISASRVWWPCRPPKSLLGVQLRVCTCHVRVGLVSTQ
jgi:hypothetical protein